MLTAAQRDKRKAFIGSSDIAALCGLSEFANAHDIWLEKTGRLVEGNGSAAAEMGNDLEGAVLSMFERERGIKVVRNIWLERETIFCANLDGAICDSDQLTKGFPNAVLEPVEAKSTGYQEFWGKEGAEIPPVVLCQVAWQMMVIGAHCERGWVPVLFPGYKKFDFKIFPVERTKSVNELIEVLVEQAFAFWKLVESDTPPENLTPHLPTLKRVRREAETVISLDDEAAEEWAKFERARERVSKWEATKEQRYARLVTMLGASEAGRLPDGRMLTYMEQSGARHCDFDLLQAEAPELYKRLVTQGRFRVLRMKKAKIGGKKRG